MKKLNKKGFTLVELIVVIVIIAILAAALVTSLIGYVNKANETTALNEANNVYTAAQAYCSENGDISVGLQTFSTEATGLTETNLIKAVNDYLGSDIVAAGEITVFKTSDKSTITELTYKASNGKTVTYSNNAWTVA